MRSTMMDSSSGSISGASATPWLCSTMREALPAWTPTFRSLPSVARTSDPDRV